MKGLMHCALVGLVNCLASLSFIFALTRIDVAVAGVIVSFYPAAVIIIIALRREQVTKMDVFRLMPMLVGVYLVLSPDGGVDLYGAILVIFTAVMYAIYLVLIQLNLSGYGSKTIALYVIFFMALYSSVIFIALPESWKPLSLKSWAIVLTLGVISTALSMIVVFTAIRQIGSRQVAMLSGPLEPLGTVLLAMLFLGERMATSQIIGAAMLILSTLPAIANNRRDIGINAVDKGKPKKYITIK